MQREYSAQVLWIGKLKNCKKMKIMKKIVFFAAVAALAAVSCVKDGYTSDVQTTVVKATVSETKTALVNNTKTYWTKGDQISVFNAGKGNCQFTTAIEEASAHAEFTYTGDWAAPEVYHAFYPYSASIATEDFTTFTGLEIPAVQTAVADGFDPKAALLYGEGASANLLFSNLTALIKFTVAADEVYNVKVWATGANIAGTCSFDGEKLTGASSMWVQLKGVMRRGKTFYMAVAPGTYEGLNVFVNGLPLSEKNKTNRTLEAGVIYDMGEITNPRSSVVTWYTTTTPEPQITEADIADASLVNTSHGDWTYSDASKGTAFVSGACGTWNTEGTAYGYKIYHVAEDGKTLTSGGETVVLTTADYTDNGQMYAVPYNKYAPALYFNIDWETKYNGQDNVYALVDLQDRTGKYNSVYLSKSYYDATARKFVFDIAFFEYDHIKRMYGQLAK